MLVTFSGCGAAIGTLRGSAPEAAKEKCLSLALRSGPQIVSSSARCCAEAATLINAPLVVSSHSQFFYLFALFASLLVDAAMR
jgi:hypothetical protein